jgi:small subunit ribosomal protein S7
MPRRARSYERRIPAADPKFNSVKYAKFINYLMERGKKTVAQKIFYTAIDTVTEKMASQKDPNNDEKPLDGRQVFEIALKNVSPMVEIKGRRIGGSNYQVPMEVQEPRKTTLGMKWMILAARARKGAPMGEKLAAEIVDAFNKLGNAVKKREDTHRMAEANKAFAHFARFGNKRK